MEAKKQLMISSISGLMDQVADVKSRRKTRTPILYRGQPNSDWKIRSSLERFGILNISANDYYTKIDSFKPLMNPKTDTRFEQIVKTGKYPGNFDEPDIVYWYPPELEYLTFLRHHSFPTPLIDFTLSPYIGLFFACEDFIANEHDAKFFILMEKEFHVSLTSGPTPKFLKIGEYIETHHRHFAQQSNYIIPHIFDDQQIFTTFETAIAQTSCDFELMEILIDGKAKWKIMNELKEMNITRYTIYLDEESLIKHFADRWALELREANALSHYE